MKLNRRSFLLKSAAISSLVAAYGQYFPRAAARDNVETGANGLFVQPWFEDSFLDLSEDLKEAAQAGKQLVIIYEQAGCPYCKELHKVNLNKPSIAAFMKKHFHVVQIDIKGSREVTDFSGKVMSERSFSREWKIHFTPTLSFFPRDAAKVVGKTGRDAEAFRLTGYWKPFHFETVLHFVHSGSYKNENLQHYLSNRLEALKGKGEEVKVWD